MIEKENFKYLRILSTEKSKKMWSDRYNYYDIQFDEQYSEKLEKSFIVEVLLKAGFFKQETHQTFRNTDKFPWVDIALVETNNGSFSLSDKENQFVNLIAIVCSKGEHVDQQIYITAFKNIADKLNWKLYLEEDDDENQNIQL